MERAIDGRGRFRTPDGLDLRVTLAIVVGDGPPRVEVASVQAPDERVPLPALERAARVYLYELTAELRRHAYRGRPCRPDPKPKDRGRRVAR